MNRRFLVIGTIAAAVALFAWQTVSNAALPWHEETMREFPDNAAAVQAIRAQAPVNGVYFSPQGVLAAVSFTPDLADKTQTMGGMLVRQLLIDLAAALALAFLVTRFPAPGAVYVGTTLALAGLAAGMIAHLSSSNWYGFPSSYALVNTADLAINLFVAGVVLGALKGRAERVAEGELGVAAGTRGAEAVPSPVGQPTRTL